jgi:hypothetical protein
MRALIAEHHPYLRDHIKVTATPAEPTPVEKLLKQIDGSGLRDLTITIGSDGTVSTSGGAAATGGEDEDPATLASAVDAALDEAANLLDGFDLTGLPDPVQQALALVQAAGVAVDELLDVMGIDDPDHGGEDLGDRALSAEELKKLPDTAFAYIDGKGGRHLPINDPPHVRNALARFDQAQFESDTDKNEAKSKINAAAKKFGIDTGPGSGKRSEEPDRAADAALDADLARIQDRLARIP